MLYLKLKVQLLLTRRVEILTRQFLSLFIQVHLRVPSTWNVRLLLHNFNQMPSKKVAEQRKDFRIILMVK